MIFGGSRINRAYLCKLDGLLTKMVFNNSNLCTNMAEITKLHM